MSSSQTRWKPKWCWVPEPSLVVSNMVHRVQPCAPSKEHRAALCARCCLPPEKAQVPNNIFASILSENCSLCTALIFALLW